MVGGYVSIPEKFLEGITTGRTSVIPGSYSQMKTILTSRKPIIGTYTTDIEGYITYLGLIELYDGAIRVTIIDSSSAVYTVVFNSDDSVSVE